jgi:hypothetical protein
LELAAQVVLLVLLGQMVAHLPLPTHPQLSHQMAEALALDPMM